ncbi:MAG: hypothetical protein KC731_32875 [Myxococcales bacterium]|nr:hypothetical protein [Myxococcales bacterium]
MRPCLLVVALALAACAPTAPPMTPTPVEVAPAEVAAPTLARVVPADAWLFAELRDVPGLFRRWAGSDDLAAALGAAMAAEIGISPRDASRFMASIEAVGLMASGPLDDPELALVLGMSQTVAAEQILRESLFEPAPHRAYVLSDATLELLELEASPVIAVEAGMVVLGTNDAVAGIRGLAAGPSLATQASFRAAWAGPPSLLTALFDVGAKLREGPETRPLAARFFATGEPLWLRFDLEPVAQLRLGAELAGPAVPRDLFGPARKLALASRLPSETIAYLAYDSSFARSGDEMMRLLESLGGDELREELGELDVASRAVAGLSLGEVVDALGDEGVIGAMMPTTSHGRGDLIDGSALVWVQELATTPVAQRAVEALFGAMDGLVSKDVVRREGGYDMALEVSGRHVTLAVRRQPGIFVLVAGPPAMVERGLAAVLRGDRQLASHAAHERTRAALDPARVVQWLDTTRALDLVQRERPDIVQSLQRLSRFGEGEAGGAFALAWADTPRGTQVGLQVLDLTTMGLVGAVGIHGVRQYLARSKLAEAEATLRLIGEAGMRGSGVTPRCASSLPVPAEIPQGHRYMPAPSDFAAGGPREGWPCLDVALATPIRFRYRFTAGGPYLGPARGLPDPGPRGFEVAAEGDLDADGVTSLMTMVATPSPVTGRLELDPEIYEADELE